MKNNDLSVTSIKKFDKEIRQLKKKYPSIANDVNILVKALISNPLQGQPIGRDCYKIRLSISSKSKGKRGGARVITCIKIIGRKIILISIYDKSQKDDLAKGELEEALKEVGLLK